MHIAILTFDGYNELDSLIALGVLNRSRPANWRISIASPTATVTSMNGVTIHSHINVSEACQADAVIVGSGIKTREIIENHDIMAQLKTLDPTRQIIGAQCSGALILAKLGLLDGVPACTDSMSKPWVIEAGIKVLNQAFFAKGNIATAGGCLASAYLGAWVNAKLSDETAAWEALHYLAPVGEKDAYVAQAKLNILPYLS